MATPGHSPGWPPNTHGRTAAGNVVRRLVRDRGEEEDLPQAEVGRGPAAMPGDALGLEPAQESGELRERRLSWAELMQRVYAVDVLTCPACGGRRRLIAVITQREVIIAFLASLGLPTRAPPLAPVRQVDPGEADPGEADPLRS